MKTTIFKICILAIIFIFHIGSSHSANPNRTYKIKYILDNEGYAIPDKTTMTITNSRIYIYRNGVQKYWDCEYKGIKIDEPVKGKQIKFHVYYLTNKNIYLLISDYKVIKHNDVFYYSVNFAGQTQLSL